jgi:hypothetical protein
MAVDAGEVVAVTLFAPTEKELVRSLNVLFGSSTFVPRCVELTEVGPTREVHEKTGYLRMSDQILDALE